jgi:hypothetical protein
MPIRRTGIPQTLLELTGLPAIDRDQGDVRPALGQFTQSGAFTPEGVGPITANNAILVHRRRVSVPDMFTWAVSAVGGSEAPLPLCSDGTYVYGTVIAANSSLTVNNRGAGIWRSDNLGGSWTRVDAGSTIGDVCSISVLGPGSANPVIVAFRRIATVPRVYYSTDSGVTWTECSYLDGTTGEAATIGSATQNTAQFPWHAFTHDGIKYLAMAQYGGTQNGSAFWLMRDTNVGVLYQIHSAADMNHAHAPFYHPATGLLHLFYEPETTALVNVFTVAAPFVGVAATSKTTKAQRHIQPVGALDIGDANYAFELSDSGGHGSLIKLTGEDYGYLDHYGGALYSDGATTTGVVPNGAFQGQSTVESATYSAVRDGNTVVIGQQNWWPYTGLLVAGLDDWFGSFASYWHQPVASGGVFHMFSHGGYLFGRIALAAGDKGFRALIPTTALTTAIRLQPAATNLIANVNRAGAEVDATGCWQTPVTMTSVRHTADFLTGSGCYRTYDIDSSGGNGTYFYVSFPSVGADRYIVGSQWVKAVLPGMRKRSPFLGDSHVFPLAADSPIHRATLSDQRWIRIAQGRALPSGDTGYVESYATLGSDAAYVNDLVDNLAAEVDQLTDWIPGAASRAASTLIRYRNLPAAWTDVFTVWPTGNPQTINPAAGKLFYIQTWKISATVYATLRWKGENSRFELLVTDGVNTETLYSGTQWWQPESPISFAVQRDADGKIRCWIANASALTAMTDGANAYTTNVYALTGAGTIQYADINQTNGLALSLAAVGMWASARTSTQISAAINDVTARERAYAPGSKLWT